MNILFEKPPVSRLKRLQNYIKSLPNLVAYYPLDELSGNAINRAPATIGTLDGSVSNVTYNQAGQLGIAYLFNGTTSTVEVTDHANIDLSTSFSLFALVNPTTIGEGGAGRIFDKNSTYGLLFAGTNQMQIFSDATTKSTGNNQITFAGWQIIIATVNAGVETLFYKNGVVISTNTSMTAPTPNANNLFIGNRSDGARALDGLAQHLGIVAGVITPAQALRMAQLAGLA